MKSIEKGIIEKDNGFKTLILISKTLTSRKYNAKNKIHIKQAPIKVRYNFSFPMYFVLFTTILDMQ